MQQLEVLKVSAAAILSLLLVVSVCFFTAFSSIESFAFNPYFYDNQLAKAGVYLDIAGAVGGMAVARLPVDTSFGAGAQLKSAVMGAFSEEWAREQTLELLRNFFSYIKGESASLSLSVSIVKPKQEINGAIKERFPYFSDEQISQALGSEETIDLGKGLPNAFRQTLEEMRNAFSLASLFKWLAAIAAIASIALLAFIFKNKTALLFYSASLIASSLFLFLVAALAGPIARQAIGSASANGFGVEKSLDPIIDSAFNAFASNAMLYVFVLIALGLISAAVFLVFYLREEKKPAEKQPEENA
ncbi:MAG: hypothetical protein V1494_01875 [Candidatus Diapherotrites archaeon]